METNLTDKAMLVTLTVGAWTGSKVDKEITAKVAKDAKADADAGRYTKSLVSKHSLQNIQTLSDQARTVHYSLTMQWDDYGNRLLPIALYDRYVDKLDDLIERRLHARQVFLDEYQGHIEASKYRLGEMFNPTDYPPKDTIRDKISMVYAFMPVPDASHFIVDMVQADADRIRQEIEQRIDGKINGTVVELYQRIGTAVKSCSDRLSLTEKGNPKVFRDSMVHNLRDIAKTVTDMNITGDEALNKIAQDIDTALQDVTAEDLREKSRYFRPETHKRVKSTMDDLSAKFAGYFGETQ